MGLPTNYTDATAMLGGHAAAHNTTNKWLNNLGIFSVIDYGAKGDGKVVTDGAMTVGIGADNVLTSAVAGFTALDVGKHVTLNGAGAAGATLAAIITGYTNTTTVTLSANALTTVSGANLSYATDDTASIRNAVFDAVVKAGIVLFPVTSGDFWYIDSNGGIVPSRAGGLGGQYPVVLQGAGMFSTILKMGPNAGTLLHYSIPGAGFPAIAQTFVYDLTLDGNYAGVNGGAIPQNVSPNGHLVSLPQPYTSATSTQAQFNGLYHEFERVRFYRPPCFTTQGLTARIEKCVFDQVGQPDVASNGLHWDNMGNGGACDIMAINSTWVNSSGNYADFVSATPNDFMRITFIGNKSTNHQIGGVYACGTRSVIMGNDLENNFPGSYIGYDSSTDFSNRYGNIVALNTLKNIDVNNGSLNPAQGDRVFGNTAHDVPKAAFLTPPTPDGTITGTANPNNSTNIVGTGTLFTQQLSVGDRVRMNGASSGYAFVTAIASDTSMTVSSPIGDGLGRFIGVKHQMYQLQDAAGNIQSLLDDRGYLGIGVSTPGARADVAASTTGGASIRVRAGVAPTSPNDGDMWYDGTHLYIRVGGTTTQIV